jgi:hypothetical protein
MAAVLEAAKLAERVGLVKGEIRVLRDNLARHEQELEDYLALHPPLLSSR